MADDQGRLSMKDMGMMAAVPAVIGLVLFGFISRSVIYALVSSAGIFVASVLGTEKFYHRRPTGGIDEPAMRAMVGCAVYAAGSFVVCFLMAALLYRRT